MKARTSPALVGLMLCAFLVSAQETRTERVQFHRGETGATVKGHIKGYEDVHYLLGAKAGQSMVVNLSTDNNANYFNIFAPGKKPGEDEAMFIGSTEGNHYEGELTADGDYLVQVYLMRSAARRDEVANYTLEVGISGSADSGGVSMD
ncbi:MAG TPA: DNA breaking-rejoining protein [Vicinamibacteria bacterium]|nr:DNA breaking-rejoining protein [Vicinamibacteria bacterium]